MFHLKRSRRKVGWKIRLIYSFVLLSAVALVLSNGFLKPSSAQVPGGKKTEVKKVFRSKVVPRVDPFSPAGVVLRKRLDKFRQKEAARQFSSQQPSTLGK